MIVIAYILKPSVVHSLIRCAILTITHLIKQLIKQRYEELLHICYGNTYQM